MPTASSMARAKPGLGGVTVELTFAGQDGIFGNADDFAVSTTTDADGDYSFAMLPDGDYRITDVSGLPTGMVDTSDYDGTADGVANATVTGGSVTGVNLGYRGGGTIGDFVWLDGEGDGIQSGQDRGLTDIGVTPPLSRCRRSARRRRGGVHT